MHSGIVQFPEFRASADRRSLPSILLDFYPSSRDARYAETSDGCPYAGFSTLREDEYYLEKNLISTESEVSFEESYSTYFLSWKRCFCGN